MQQFRGDIELAAVRAEHAPNMARWMLDPLVRNNIDLRSQPSLARTLAWIERVQSDASIAALAILRAGQHVGNITLDQVDSHTGLARLSIYIGEATARGNGIGRTAAYLALKHGFEKMHLHKIWLIVHEQNLAAINTYMKLGFELEGILKDEFLIQGQRLAALRMGMLKARFEQNYPAE